MPRTIKADVVHVYANQIVIHEPAEEPTEPDEPTPAPNPEPDTGEGGEDPFPDPEPQPDPGPDTEDESEGRAVRPTRRWTGDDFEIGPDGNVRLKPGSSGQ